jgi:hypothetical protein
MSPLDRRVRRLEGRSAANAESLTVVLHYVSADGGEDETVHLRYDRPGFPPTRSGDGGRTWSEEGTR